jgi:hypothetical protein
MSEKQKDRYFPKLGSYKELLKRTSDYYARPQKFHTGDYVYLDTPKKTFTKGKVHLIWL